MAQHPRAARTGCRRFVGVHCAEVHVIKSQNINMHPQRSMSIRSRVASGDEQLFTFGSGEGRSIRNDPSAGFETNCKLQLRCSTIHVSA